MTLCLGLNANNDIYLGADGNLVMLSGIEAVLTACQTAVKSQLGEMIFMQNFGLPNFQLIWEGTPNTAIYQAYLLDLLGGVEGVQSVSNLTITQNGNILSYTATITTIYGLGVLNG